MNLKVIGIIGIIGMMMALPSIPTSESTLWDLLISVELEQNPVEIEKQPVVIGNVIDHAGKPVVGAVMKIRVGEQSVSTLTDNQGNFRYMLEVKESGRYIVNVMGMNSDDKIGMASTEFKVKGEESTLDYYTNDLEFLNITQFANITEAELEKDPIKKTMYNHYLKLQEQILEEQVKIDELKEEQEFLDIQRGISDEFEQYIINETNPGAGIYAGWKKDRFVDNLDLSIKDIIVNQLNYTVNVFNEAQKAMNEVLLAGGTYDEARQAYLEKATIPREIMESLTIEQNEIVNGTAINTNSTAITNATSTTNDLDFTYTINDEKDSNEINVNGTAIEVGSNATIIRLNVNGTMIELFVNGTEVSQITNSTAN